MKTLIKRILTEEVRAITEKHKVFDDEFTTLYKDDDFMFVIPLTHNASKKYGSGTKWCTTKKDCDLDFKNHIKLGVLGYIVIRNEELKTKFKNNAFAVYRLFSDNSHRFIAFDDQNNEYRNGESWLENIFDRYDRISQYYKMISAFNFYYDNKNKSTINEDKRLKPETKFIKNWLNQFGVLTEKTSDDGRYLYLTTNSGLVLVKVDRQINETYVNDEMLFQPILKAVNSVKLTRNKLISWLLDKYKVTNIGYLTTRSSRHLNSN